MLPGESVCSSCYLGALYPLISSFLKSIGLYLHSNTMAGALGEVICLDHHSLVSTPSEVPISIPSAWFGIAILQVSPSSPTDYTEANYLPQL